MPYDNVEISTFNGMVGSLDERDHPPGTAIYAQNIDFITQAGLFSGLPEDTDTSVAVKGKIFVKYGDGTKAAYYDETAGECRVVSGLGQGGTPAIAGTPQVSATAEGSGNRCGVSDGDAVHMGLGATSSSEPKWVGTIYHKQFEGSGNEVSVPANDSVLDAELKTLGVIHDYANDGDTRTLPDLSGGISVNEQVFFYVGQAYYYYYSCIYDGKQLSPLKWLKTVTVSSTATDFKTTQTDAAGYKSIAFNVRAYEVNAATTSDDIIQRRVTGIKIYRSEGNISVSGGEVVEGTPQLVKYLDINDSGWSSVAEGTSWEAGSSGWEITLTDTGETYESFEDEAEFPSTLEHMQIHYGLSCSVNGYHIVGDCWHQDLKDTDTWLFRSKLYRYDTFDWSQDYLNLDAKPRALVAWNNRVYAFMEGYTIVINPVTFDEEYRWDGISTHAPQSVATSDRGMFFTDYNNIYINKGVDAVPIGRPVLRNPHTASAAWLNHDRSQEPMCVYHPQYDSYIVIYKYSGTFYGLLFHEPSGRWVHLDITMPASATDFTGTTSFGDGEPLISSDTNLMSVFSAGTNRSWRFVGQQMHSLGRRNKFYAAHVESKQGFPIDGTGFDYYEDDPNYFSANNWSVTSSSSVNSIVVQIEGKVNSGSGPPWTQVRSFAIEVDGSGTEDVSHITLKRRVMGAR